MGVDANADNLADFYEARVLSATDYYAFGMSMKERSFQADSYRYGFNGKEKDGDIGEETYDFDARLLSAKIGRFFSVDRRASLLPFASPYAYALNNPIVLTDKSGEYPTSAAVDLIQSTLNVKLSPVVAGVIDGIVENNVFATIMGVVDIGKMLLTESGREQIKTMVAAIASDPINFVKEMVKQEIGDIAEMLEGGTEGQYKLGKKIGEKTAEAMSGGLLAIAGKVLKKFTKLRVDVTNSKNGKTHKISELTGDEEQLFKAVKTHGISRLSGITLDNLPSDELLRKLTDEYGVEFAVTYTAGKNNKKGYYNLFVGNVNSVELPLESNTYLLKHTHPKGTLEPSEDDVEFLKKHPNQKKSVILPKDKPKTNFTKDTPFKKRG